MGKKRYRQADLNEDGSEESTESYEGSDSKGGKECPHFPKSINLVKLKKELKKTGIKRECAACQRDEANSPQVVEEGYEPCPPILWVCLQCGNQACGRFHKNHAVEHFKTPHSDCHSLVVDTHQWSVWCYDCDDDLSPDYRKKLLETVEILKRTPISNINQTPKAKPQAPQNKEIPPEKEKQKILFGLSKVVGLANLGNTCFFNAVLQCLAQTPFLVKTLEDLQKPGQTFVLPGGKYKKPGSSEEIILPPIEGSLEYGNSCNFTQTLRKTLTEMQSSNGQQTYSPRELLSSFRKKTMQCMDGGQHDSHELLRHLLEIVRNEDLRRYQIVILRELEIGKLKPKNNAGDPTKDIDDDKKSRVKFYGHQASARLLGPEPVFRGILVSTLECLECHHSSPRTEPFLDLSLPVMADKPQPPVFKRKNSGFEDAFDMMTSNSSNNVAKTPGKREIRAAKKAAKKEQKNIKHSQFNFSQLDNTFENSESVDGDNASRSEKPGDYLASGSDTDVEDNVETESGNEPLLKSQEILESGYSSEKPSAVTSPVSAADVDASLNYLSKRYRNAIVPANYFESRKIGGSGEISSPAEIPEEKLNLTNVEKTGEIDESLSKMMETGTSPDSTTANLISSSNNSEECRPLGRESSREKLVDDEGRGENGDDEKELVNFFGPDPEPEADKEASQVTSPEMKSNSISEEHSATNGVAKLTGSLSRMGIHHSNQSPTRYFTNEGEFSIQSCLNQFTAQELMSGNNKVGCEACTAKENKGKENKKMVCTPSTKQYLISKVPAVLILHLKRFQSQRVGLRKVTKHVNFPTLLDLAPVCKNHEKPKLYSLYGVVEHSGTLYGGHYVAYVKTRQPLGPNDPRWSFLPTKEATENEGLSSSSSSESENEEASAKSSNVEPPPGRWYYISDSRVTEVDESIVLQTQAYVLFYERIL
ncbi:ubiquitin carboxyl-terminal hydrolase 45 isoform X2 [Belonocnema kinseyi]|uniref:ubiquitin carboxyl-terminal hydrolase 45 isoform X2 n=1 Tax=Belonocnema kinseyi TaxID=2817044 RepID=UPI00143CC6C9|nr:ubiquitin carboxyl-terminal hydrolase 45 isoform X2 [Belonocnema kinseyi]